jgi:magnesium-transporting ATPase (P-type)
MRCRIDFALSRFSNKVERVRGVVANKSGPLGGIEKLCRIRQTFTPDDPDLSVGDRSNMAYAGTIVTYGRGLGLVVVTGMQTEFGKVARMLQTVEVSRTPLQENLDKVGKALAKVAVAVIKDIFDNFLLCFPY